MYVCMDAQFCYSYISTIVQDDYTMLTDLPPNQLSTCLSSVAGRMFGHPYLVSLYGHG